MYGNDVCLIVFHTRISFFGEQNLTLYQLLVFISNPVDHGMSLSLWYYKHSVLLTLLMCNALYFGIPFIPQSLVSLFSILKGRTTLAVQCTLSQTVSGSNRRYTDYTHSGVIGVCSKGSTVDTATGFLLTPSAHVPLMSLYVRLVAETRDLISGR